VSEDMDSLTFGSPILIRGLGNKDKNGGELVQINLDKVLSEMNINYD
jgi:hypothetical protein